MSSVIKKNNCNTIHDKKRSLIENTQNTGYVTVIKNKGKWNEELIQKR